MEFVDVFLQYFIGLTGAMLAAVAASVTYECLNEYLLHLKRVARRSEDRLVST